MKESSVELKDMLSSKTCKMDSQIRIFGHYFNITDYIIKYGTDRAFDGCYELNVRIYT